MCDRIWRGAATFDDRKRFAPLQSILPFFLHSQEARLTDGAGSKPAYSLRTLCRALDYARTTAPHYGLQRALYDGFSMAFATQVCLLDCVAPTDCVLPYCYFYVPE